MKRIISLLLILSVFFGINTVCAEEKASASSEFINNEIFVMYKDGAHEVITFENEDDFHNITDGLSKNGDVLFYQPNYTYAQTALETSDAFASMQWALSNDGTFYMEEQKNEFPVFDTPFGDAKMPGEWLIPDNFGRPGGIYRRYSSYYSKSPVSAKEGIDINLEDAYDIYSDSGKEITVAMVDTGIDYTHEDLSGRIWTNTGEIASNGIDDDGNGFTDDVYGWNFYNSTNKIYSGSSDDHATHGAGTIAAETDNGIGIAGIAKSENIKVMSVKALGGSSGSGSTSSVISAIKYAEANGASICNLSLGTSYNDRALYETIASSNMLFIVAAGNDGSNTDSSPCYPASYELENIISVANLNYDGTLDYSSNYGIKTVDIAAPGSYILSTTTSDGYSYMSGTSMAAPMVTGAVAVIYSHFDGITLANVKEIILGSAKQLESLDGAVSSGGMLDLGAALSYDISTLTEPDRDVKAPAEYKGNAPVIEAYTQGTHLILKVYDEDNDLNYVSYASGLLDAGYFENGSSETAVTLENGTAVYKASEGTYTFYASDKCGNKTVYTVNITKKSYSKPYSFGNIFGGGFGGFGGFFGRNSFFEGFMPFYR